MSHSHEAICVTVTGMSCDGCATKVRGALEACDGIASVTVDHHTGLTCVTPDGTVGADDLEFVIDEAIESVGYHVAS